MATLKSSFQSSSTNTTRKTYVNPDIPLELNIRGGMGESVLDLSRLNVSTFKLTTGAGKYTVTFPRTGNVKAEVTGGLSPTRLLIPENVAVKLEVMNERGRVEFDGNVFSQKSSFVSEHYDAAENQLELRLTSELSHVFIETVP
jgi:predicted membrane protein